MLVDEASAVDEPEQQQDEDRQDQGELDQALAGSSATQLPHGDTERVTLVEPLELVTVNVTDHVPLLLGKEWNGLGALLDGDPSPKSHSHVWIGQGAGAVDPSVKVMFRRGLPDSQLKLATGLGHGVAVGVGVGAAVGVGVGPEVGVGVGVGAAVGVGVGAAGGTVTVRMAVREPPWLVTSSVIAYVPGDE